MKAKMLSALHGLHQNNIFGPAASAFFLRASGAAIQFIFTLLLARFYGASGVGVYAISLSILVVTATVVRWGLDQAVLKFVSSNLHTEKIGTVRGILSYARGFILVAGIMATIVVMLLSDLLSALFFGNADMAPVIRVMSAAILPLSITTLYAEAMRGLKRIAAYTLLHGTLTPLLSIVFLVSISRIWQQGVITGATAYLTACICVMLIAAVLWRRSMSKLAPMETPSKRDRREIISTANAFSWITIISVGMSFTETLVLGIFQDDVSVGLYAASLRLVLIINFIILGFNSILAPTFASLYQQGKLAEIETLAVQSILIMLTLTSPIILVFVTMPEWILSFFGTGFVKAAPSLILLTLGQLIIVFFGPVAILLQMTGQERAFRNNVVLSASMTIITSLTLIPLLGVTGAAASSVIGTFTLNVLSLSIVHRRLGIRLSPFKRASVLNRTE